MVKYAFEGTSVYFDDSSIKTDSPLKWFLHYTFYHYAVSGKVEYIINNAGEIIVTFIDPTIDLNNFDLNKIYFN